MQAFLCFRCSKIWLFAHLVVILPNNGDTRTIGCVCSFGTVGSIGQYTGGCFCEEHFPAGISGFVGPDVIRFADENTVESTQHRVVYPARCRGGRVLLPRPDAAVGNAAGAVLPLHLSPTGEIRSARCGQRDSPHRGTEQVIFPPHFTLHTPHSSLHRNAS